MEIAEEIGISQAQVSRLEKGGIENIKKKILWLTIIYLKVIIKKGSGFHV